MDWLIQVQFYFNFWFNVEKKLDEIREMKWSFCEIVYVRYEVVSKSGSCQLCRRSEKVRMISLKRWRSEGVICF